MQAESTQAGRGWRWAPAWVLGFVALWPAPGIAEAVLALGALAGVVHLLQARFRGGAGLLSGPACSDSNPTKRASSAPASGPPRTSTTNSSPPSR